MADDIGLRVVLLGVGEFRRGVGIIRSDLSGLQKELNGVSGPAAALSSKLNEIGGTMIQAGRSMTLGLTLPIVALGTSLVNAGIQFEDAFADVLKTTEGTVVGFDDLAKAMYGTTTGLSDAQKEAVFANEKFGQLTKVGEELRNQFRDLALEIPMSAAELSRLGGIAGQLGVPTDQILEFTRTIAMLGTATNMSAEQAADAIARFANIMDVPSEKLADFALRAGSAIVDLGNKSAATESQIVDLVYRISGAGNAIGLTAQEIIALSTSVAELGVRAEAGGSAVSRILLNIQTAAGEGGEQLKTYADMIGLTTQQFQELVKNSPLEAFYKVASALATLQEQGKLSSDMLTELDLNTIRLRDVINRFGPDMGGLAKNVAEANKAWDEEIALEEEARKKYQTVKAQIQLLKNAFSDLGITLFDLYHNEIVNLISGIQGIFKALAKTDSKLVKTAVKFALLAAAIGPVLIALGTITQLAGVAIGALGAMAGPIGLIVLAVGAIGIAFSENFLGIRDAFNNIIGTAGNVVDTLKGIAYWIGQAFNFGANAPGGNFITGLAQSLRSLTYVFQDNQTTFFSQFLESLGLSEGLSQKLGMTIKNVLAPPLLGLEFVLRQINDVFSMVSNWITIISTDFLRATGVISILKNAFDQFMAGDFDKGFESIQLAWDHVVMWFNGQGKQLIETALTNIYNTIKDKVDTFIPIIVQWAKDAAPDLLTNLGIVLRTIENWLLNAATFILTEGSKLGIAFLDWVVKAGTDVLPKLGTFLGYVMGWIAGTFIPWMVQTSLDLSNKFIAWIPGAVEKAGPQLFLFALRIIKFILVDLPNMTSTFVYNFGVNFIQGLLDGLNVKWKDVENWFNDKFQWIEDQWDSFWDSFSPSKKTEGWGINLMQGLINGLEKQNLPLSDTVNKMMGSLEKSMMPHTYTTQTNTTNINRPSTRVFAPNITGVPVTDQGQLTNDLSRMYRMATLANYA